MKITDKQYSGVLEDLQPIFDKHSKKLVKSVIWNMQRRENKIKELKSEQIRVEKELKQYEGSL